MRTLAYATVTAALVVGMSATATTATAAPAAPAATIQWDDEIPSGSAAQDSPLLNALLGVLVHILGGGASGSAG